MAADNDDITEYVPIGSLPVDQVLNPHVGDCMRLIESKYAVDIGMQEDDDEETPSHSVVVYGKELQVYEAVQQVIHLLEQIYAGERLTSVSISEVLVIANGRRTARAKTGAQKAKAMEMLRSWATKSRGRNETQMTGSAKSESTQKTLGVARAAEDTGPPLRNIYNTDINGRVLVQSAANGDSTTNANIATDENRQTIKEESNGDVEFVIDQDVYSSQGPAAINIKLQDIESDFHVKCVFTTGDRTVRLSPSQVDTTSAIRALEMLKAWQVLMLKRLLRQKREDVPGLSSHTGAITASQVQSIHSQQAEQYNHQHQPQNASQPPAVSQASRPPGSRNPAESLLQQSSSQQGLAQRTTPLQPTHRPRPQDTATTSGGTIDLTIMSPAVRNSAQMRRILVADDKAKVMRLPAALDETAVAGEVMRRAELSGGRVIWVAPKTLVFQAATAEKLNEIIEDIDGYLVDAFQALVI
ncbi:hypothetical protein HDU85_000825 [Gaertneriomyces sp. JEL0708]|nr:hypothetical protein HDU85_000825 [Gaertneriomyces sp. JEL0708]